MHSYFYSRLEKLLCRDSQLHLQFFSEKLLVIVISKYIKLSISNILKRTIDINRTKLVLICINCYTLDHSNCNNTHRCDRNVYEQVSQVQFASSRTVVHGYLELHRRGASLPDEPVFILHSQAFIKITQLFVITSDHTRRCLN